MVWCMASKYTKKRISICLSSNLIEQLKNIQKEIEGDNDIVKVSFSALVEKLIKEGLQAQKVRKELGLD